MNIIQQPATADFSVGRQGKTVLMIVDHWTDCDGLLADEILEGKTARQVSGHFMVSKSGEIHQHVKVGDTAWGAGDWQVNLQCINIEHEGQPGVPITDACYEASIALHRQLCDQFFIDPLGHVTFETTTSGIQTFPTICPHSRIHPTECPGTLDLGRIAAGITPNLSGVDQPIVPTPIQATIASAQIVPVTFSVGTLYNANLRTRQDLSAHVEYTVPKGTVLTAHDTVHGDTVNGSDTWYRVSYEGNDYLFVSASISKKL